MAPPSVTITPGQSVGLGRLAFAVGGGATAGLRSITFTLGDTTQLVADADNLYSDVSFVSGGIDVQGSPNVNPVPAPGSAVLLVIGVGCCGLFRARGGLLRRVVSIS